MTVEHSTSVLEWQPMESDPNDGAFRLYGLHIKNGTGFRWFDVHYVALDDTGQLIEPSGDAFSDWAYDDFEVWADAPPPPVKQTSAMPQSEDRS